MKWLSTSKRGLWCDEDASDIKVISCSLFIHLITLNSIVFIYKTDFFFGLVNICKVYNVALTLKSLETPALVVESSNIRPCYAHSCARRWGVRPGCQYSGDIWSLQLLLRITEAKLKNWCKCKMFISKPAQWWDCKLYLKPNMFFFKFWTEWGSVWTLCQVYIAVCVCAGKDHPLYLT